MQQVMQAWNSLPDEERMARAPFISAHQGSLPGVSAGELLSSLAEEEEDVPDDLPFDLPSDAHGNVLLADPAQVAAQVRAAPFVQQCRRLVEWVGDGKPVTATQVLRLAPAREAYAELDLWEWERGSSPICLAVSTWWTSRWRRRRIAGDCPWRPSAAPPTARRWTGSGWAATSWG